MLVQVNLKKLGLISVCCSILLLTACTTTTHYGKTQVRKIPAPIYYTVQSGDTLSKIGQRYGLDYVSIAQLNKIPAPYNLIEVGQRLRLKGAKSLASNQPSIAQTKVTPTVITTANTSTNNDQINTPIQYTLNWRKPTISNTAVTINNIDQSLAYFGQDGDPIYAVESGTVVYAAPMTTHGDLARFGHLIMIQHQNGYVSVYAHNDRIWVQNGQTVQAGQQIATMGMSGLNVQQPMLSFQLKQNGQTIDARGLIP